jgi:hypothetical protein
MNISNDPNSLDQTILDLGQQTIAVSANSIRGPKAEFGSPALEYPNGHTPSYGYNWPLLKVIRGHTRGIVAYFAAPVPIPIWGHTY